MRGKGEGSVFKNQKTGLWTATIELPSAGSERRRKTIRRKSKRELLDALADLKSELKLRGDLPTKGQTAEQWFTYWFEQIATKKVRPNTLRGYRSVLFQHIIPEIGNVKLEKLTAAHIRRVHDRITGRGLSSTYALLSHRVMSVSLKTAVREGRIGRNPAQLTDAPRISTSPAEALTLDEALTLLEHVSHDRELGARWATAILTGGRPGEILGMEIARITDVIDLSWQMQRMKLTGRTGVPDVPPGFEYRHLAGGLYLTRPKTTSGWRVIPLVEPLKSIIELHLANSAPNPWGLLFTSGGRPLDPSKDGENWHALLRELGIDRNVTPHGLRHTAVDLLYLAGVPEDLIIEIVGHSTRTQSRSYKTRVDRDRLLSAMRMFSALFSQQIDARSDTPAAIGQ